LRTTLWGSAALAKSRTLVPRAVARTDPSGRVIVTFDTVRRTPCEW
jgi:hypothetical protein